MKKWVKIVLFSFLGLALVAGTVIAYFYLKFEDNFDTTGKPYKNYIGYINQDKALLNDTYELCDDGAIYHTYSSAGLKAYSGTKKQFKSALAQTYTGTDFTDSGYLNFRFLVNCEGNAGWFEIIQMNLVLEESPLHPKMVDSLFQFTADSRNWNALEFNKGPGNYYMYVSYRIENGKVVEIIP